tara:strand:- start:2369 stop:2818 length:450 start_codon:yes stop_codon:yes gene_type:complete
MAAAVIARLLQAGTKQSQKAAAALLRMLKKSNTSDLSRDMLNPLSKFKATSATPGVPMERARALASVKEAASHGFPKGVKNTPGGMKTRRGLRELQSLERTAERSYNFPRKDFKPTSFRQFKRGTRRKNARKLDELRKYVDFLSRGGAG